MRRSTLRIAPAIGVTSCSRTCCSAASRSTALANGRRGTLLRRWFADTQFPSLNDDRVGRCLDRCSAATSPRYLALATHVVREFQVDLDELHNDSTTVTFYGAYADAA